MKNYLKPENTVDHGKAIIWKSALKLCSFLLIMLTAFIGLSIPSQAEEDEEEYALIDLYGYMDYEDAFAVLDLVNEERAAQGLGSLEMDEDLLDCAMYRAAELAVYYSHTRPDGTNCFTALEEWEVAYTTAGENIAAGYDSAESVMEGWMNSDGHRANILGSEYTKVGIGMFIHEDFVYWVQVFTDGTATPADPEEYEALEEVEALLFAVPSTLGKANLEINLTQKVGQEGEAIMYITNAGWEAAYFVPTSDSLEYETSDPFVVTVDDDGTLRAVGEGSATITVSLYDVPSISASQKLTITGSNKAVMEFSSKALTKALGSKAFTVKPEYNGDGAITYTSSDTSVAEVNQSTGKVTLKGVGTTEITATASRTDRYNEVTASYTLKVIPSKPKLEKATSPSYDSVKITWSESQGADGYIVYQQVDGSWKRLATVKSTSYTLDGLTCGQEYKFTVRAYKKLNGTTYCSSFDKDGITAKPVPAKPILKKAASFDYTSVKITWSESEGADGYIVYMKVDGSWKRMAAVKSTSYIQDDLICGQDYTFTVRAYKKLNGTTTCSSYDKNGITGKPALAAPKLTDISQNSSSSATLSWDKVPGATGYIVYRKTDGGKWERMAVVKDNTLSKYIDMNMAAGKQYTYTVKAYRSADGIKSYSSYNKTGISITLK